VPKPESYPSEPLVTAVWNSRTKTWESVDPPQPRRAFQQGVVVKVVRRGDLVEGRGKRR
jgi:hypothetical protein